MTASQMITKIQARFNDSDITQDLLLSMINDEIREIQSEGNFQSEIVESTISFTAGTSSKDLSTLDTPIYIKAGGILNVWYGSKNPAYKVKFITENVREFLDFTETGTPEYYWQNGNKLHIYPILDQTRDIIVSSYNVISDITSTSTELPLPREHQMVIYYGVARDLCQMFEDYNNKLTYFEDKFEDAKRKLLGSGNTSEKYRQFTRTYVDDNPLSQYNLPIVNE